MLSITHTATGALIATAIPNPAISLPLVLASHYLEDYITHWDVGTGLSDGKKRPLDAFKHEFFDLGISIALIYLLFQALQTSINWLAWTGAFVSLIPDFIEAPRNFLKWEPDWLKPINRFHARFHNSTSDIARGLAPQVALLLVVALLT